MDPTQLPEEVAERIFMLLPVEDLLSCCLVNSTWREAINKNVIWKRHCNPAIDLENVRCLVKPAFEVPKCKVLPPVCKYRVNYMREIHLRNNFRTNKYISYQLLRILLYSDIGFLDKYLLLNDSYRNRFLVWDFESKKHGIQSVPYLLQEMATQTFQSVGNYLLIVQCKLLQIYCVKDGKLALKMCRIFDKEEQFSQFIPATDTLNTWYSSNIGLCPCPCDIHCTYETVGNYFVGLVGDESYPLNDSIMHIWDLETGKKLKEDTIPAVNESIKAICCSKNSEYLYIALYLHTRDLSTRCKIFCYSLQSLQYTQFYVETKHMNLIITLSQQYVVVLPCNQWESSGSYVFLDSITGKKIVEKQFENPINPKVLDVHNSLLVYGSSNLITVVDLNTLQEILCFPVKFEVVKLYLLDCNMLLVGGKAHSFFSKRKVEVWDIKKSCRLYSFGRETILWCDRALRWIILQDKLHNNILHFW